MDLYGKVFKKNEIFFLKKLAERYHTLPLSREELAGICRNTGINSEEAYMVLTEAVRKGILNCVFFMGRRLVYLSGKIK